MKIEEKEKRCFALQLYIRIMTEGMKYKTGGIGRVQDYVTRERVFLRMWMNTELTEFHQVYIYEKYPELFRIHNCIGEFRSIFEKRNMPLRYLLQNIRTKK